MTRISNLSYADAVAQTDVMILSDGQLTRKITVADFKQKVITQATKDALGTIRVGTGLEINDAGVLSVKNYSGFTLQPASQDRLGGIRIGTGLNVDDTGVVSAVYDVPPASPTQLGMVKVGDGLSVTIDGVLSVISVDRTKFDDTGIEIGTDGDIKVYVDANTPSIREFKTGILDISVKDTNMSDGFSNIRFASSVTSHELGNELRAALLPDPEGESIDLGVPAYPWHSIYARNVYADVTGRVFGDTNGIHTGNILANDLTVAYDSYSKRFYGQLTGNVIGNSDTSSKLYTPRAINGVYFDGSADITVSDNTKLLKSGGQLNGYLTLHADPSNVMHAVTKQYADNRVNTRVPVFGGTMTGFLTLNDPPQQVLHAATKGYVDDMTATRLAKTGGSLSGFLTLHTDPTAEMHAATKDYVDNTVNAKADQLNASLTAYINQQDNTKLPLAGGTMTGFIKLHSAPTDNTHASTKLYVDTGVQDAKDLANTKLPLSGGTLTGAINAAIGVTKGFRFSQLGTDDSASIYYYRASGFLGTATDNRHLVIQVGNDVTDQIRLVAPDKNGVKINGNTAWHAGNDGIDSGLDADVLRGIHPSTNRAVNTIVVRDGANIIYADLSGNATSADTLSTARLINGTSFDGSANINFYDIFATGVNSPGPLTFPATSVRGFDAYNSSDFPGGYYSGITISGPGSVKSSQLAFQWDHVQNSGFLGGPKPSYNAYYRVNDDNNDISTWSPWQRLATGTDVNTINLSISNGLTNLESSLTTYIDTGDDARVAVAGDTMTGRLTLSADPVSALHAATKQYVDEEVKKISGTPIGTVSFFARSTPPAGWLECRGQTVTTADYPDLFNVIGYAYGGSGTSFKLPDLRGEFIRGWDNSRGIDPDRIFGSWQEDGLKSHTHSYNRVGSGSRQVDGADVASLRYQLQVGDTTGATGGTETRPRNIALLPCIKSIGNVTNPILTNEEVLLDIDAKVKKAGDTMSGYLTLHAGPTANMHAATKQYVDTVAANIPRQNLTITRGASHTVSYTNLVGQWDTTRNYFDVFPPAGKTMANILGFIASIWYIGFAGNVDGNDALRCTYEYLGDRVRVYVQNTEQQAAPAASWLAIWS